MFANSIRLRTVAFETLCPIQAGQELLYDYCALGAYWETYTEIPKPMIPRKYQDPPPERPRKGTMMERRRRERQCFIDGWNACARYFMNQD